MTFYQDLFVQRRQTVHGLRKRVLHLGQTFDCRTDEIQDANPLRLLSPTREGSISDISSQPDAAGHHDPVMRAFAASGVCWRD
jgi:hypothetical protein